LEDSTPQASVDRAIADPATPGDVADGNRRAGLPKTSGPHDGLVIRKELRGIGRFGYSVSKENFPFFAFGHFAHARLRRFRSISLREAPRFRRGKRVASKD
jgi:hypothetical protein